MIQVNYIKTINSIFQTIYLISGVMLQLLSVNRVIGKYQEVYILIGIE